MIYIIVSICQQKKNMIVSNTSKTSRPSDFYFGSGPLLTLTPSMFSIPAKSNVHKSFAIGLRKKLSSIPLYKI